MIQHQSSFRTKLNEQERKLKAIPVQVEMDSLQRINEDLQPPSQQSKRATKFQELQAIRESSGELQPTRIYQTKERKNGRTIFDIYDEIIPEHTKFEHTKVLEDIINEIYAHTSTKVAQSFKRGIQAFSKLKDLKTDLRDQPAIKLAICENISHPLDYKRPDSYQQTLKTKALALRDLRQIAREQEINFQGQPWHTVQKIDLATAFRDPQKTAALHNSFYCYMKKGQGSSPAKMIEKHNKREQESIRMHQIKQLIEERKDNGPMKWQDRLKLDKSTLQIAANFEIETHSHRASKTTLNQKSCLASKNSIHHRVISTFDHRSSSMLNAQTSLLEFPQISQQRKNNASFLTHRTPVKPKPINPSELVPHYVESSLLQVTPSQKPIKQAVVPKSDRFRTPRLNDPEIQLQIKKYPIPPPEEQSEFQFRVNELARICKQIDNQLTTEPAVRTIRQHELEILLERYRGDQELLTNELIPVNSANKKQLKKLYNYKLVSLRDQQEMADDLEQEFRYKKFHVDKKFEVIARQHEAKQKYLGMQRKKRDRQLAQIYYDPTNDDIDDLTD